jgi:hypothetical protein
MTYWNKATQEQRLAQIDAGISLGMTSKQIAMCLSAPMYGRDGHDNAVKTFGQYHGRHFPTPQGKSAAKAREVAIRTVKTLAGRKYGVPEIHNESAFSIFGNTDEPNPFNALLPEPVE